jgi:hypothetical protein
MAIYTSRYGNKALRDEGYYPVGISLGSPKFPLGYELRDQCYALAPKGFMLKMEYAPYREAYFKKLEDIGVDKVIGIVQRLDTRAQDEDKSLVLLCYEDLRNPENWCHRTLFAEWWQKYTGELIEELEEAEPLKGLKSQKAEEPPEEKPSQISLF